MLNKKMIQMSKAEDLIWEIADIERPSGTNVASFMSVLYTIYLYKVLEFEKKDEPIKKDGLIKKLRDCSLSFNGLKEEVVRVLDNFVTQFHIDRILSISKKYDVEDVVDAIVNFRFSNFFYSEYQSPESLINLGSKILEIKEEEKVLDFCSGIGSFIVNTALEKSAGSIEGVELSLDAYSASVLRCSLLELKDGVHLNMKDAMMLEGKYDKIFANIPLNFRYDGEKYKEFLDESPELIGSRSMDWLFAKKISMLMNPDNENSKAVVFMTLNPLLQRIAGLKNAREYFLMKGLIETVIQLPEKMLYPSTSIPICAVVLSNKKENKKGVKFIKADEYYHAERRRNVLTEEDVDKIMSLIKAERNNSRYVSIDEIFENELSLVPSEYLDSGLKIPYAERFNSVMLSLKRGAPLTSDRLDMMVSTEPTNYKYLQLGDIQDGEISSNLKHIVIEDDSYDKYVIKKNDLIISKNGTPFKVAVANFDKEGKVIGCGNLYSISLDESKVNPYYLKAMFESELGKKILNKASSGSVIKMISVQNIGNMTIPVPPMSVQNRIAEEYIFEQKEIDKIRKRLREAEENKRRIFEEFIE